MEHAPSYTSKVPGILLVNLIVSPPVENLGLLSGLPEDSQQLRRELLGMSSAADAKVTPLPEGCNLSTPLISIEGGLSSLLARQLLLSRPVRGAKHQAWREDRKMRRYATAGSHNRRVTASHHARVSNIFQSHFSCGRVQRTVQRFAVDSSRGCRTGGCLLHCAHPPNDVDTFVGFRKVSV